MPDTTGPFCTRLAPGRHLLWLGLLMVLALATYANSLHHPFLIDDQDAIVSHPAVIAGGDWTLAITQDYWAGRTSEDANLYRPVTLLSYRLNRMATGLDATAFRLVNLLLLVAVAWMAGCLVRPLMALPLAVLLSALLVVHPANMELIHHLVGRADLLAMLGVLGFLALSQDACQRGRWTLAMGTLAGVMVVFALGSKEIGWILLPAAMAQLYVAHGSWPFVQRVVWQTVGLMAAVALVFVLLRARAVGWWPTYAPGWAHGELTGNPLQGLGLLERLPASAWLVWHYAWQWLVPAQGFHLTPDPLATATSMTVLAGAAIWLLLSGAVLWSLWRRSLLAPVLVLAWAAFLLVGQVLTPTGVLVAGRLNLVFVLVALVLLLTLLDRLAGLWPTDVSRAEPSMRPLLKAMIVVGVVAVAAAWMATIVNNEDWSSVQRRMQMDHEAQPENAARAYLYASTLLEGEMSLERLLQAHALLLEVVRARPDSVEARYQLAGVEAMMDQLETARDHYHWILEQRPDHVHAREALIVIEGLMDQAP